MIPTARSDMYDHPGRSRPLTHGRGALAGALAGGAGGLALYAVMAAVSVAKGHSVFYPALAVDAMMVGGRPLPGFGSTTDVHALSAMAGVFWFWVPAVTLGTSVGLMFRRRPDRWRAVCAAAVILTAALFVVDVLWLGDHRVPLSVQRRTSSGHGVRELGNAAWLVGHACYVTVLLLVLRPTVHRLTRRARATTLLSDIRR